MPQCFAAVCGGKVGQSTPEECSTPGEADDCAIIVSLSGEKKEDISTFILLSQWELWSKQLFHTHKQHYVHKNNLMPLNVHLVITPLGTPVQSNGI